MTPAVLRAMRGAVGWSMRDLANAAGVSLATVLKAEHAGAIASTTDRKLRSALAKQGVTVRMVDGAAVVRIAAPPRGLKATLLTELGDLPYVTVRPRRDGSHRVLFEVPRRLRPAGWPACRPLPFSYPRSGRLEDPAEVKAIRRDALDLLNQFRSFGAQSVLQGHSCGDGR